MSRPGAIDPATTSAVSAARDPAASDSADRERSGPDSSAPDDFFLPNFCDARSVFVVVLVGELLAMVLALARQDVPFMVELGRVSLIVQWLALTAAGLLCLARPWLARLPVGRASAAVFALIAMNTAVISGAALLLTATTLEAWAPAAGAGWSFVLRNEAISLIVTALLLRHFYIANQWRRQVRAEARWRLDALQARIRPHFLFNSMNTIAALTRSDPARAEAAVEDLADLFRATLRDSERLLRLKEELELARIYQRIEEARLGDRLRVRWTVDQLPMRGLIPALTIQPLLENAIFHGIEPLADGGTVTIDGRLEQGDLVIAVANPVPTTPAETRGHRMALDNVRQRLALAFGERGSLTIRRLPDRYEVTLRFPHRE